MLDERVVHEFFDPSISDSDGSPSLTFFRRENVRWDIKDSGMSKTSHVRSLNPSQHRVLDYIS